MPNHIHGIVAITNGPESGMGRAENIRPLCPYAKSGSIGAIVRGFKIGVTKRLGRSVFQRNYYEHIVRDGDDYEQIRNYINSNPRTWDSDKLYQKQLDEFNKRFSS